MNCGCCWILEPIPRRWSRRCWSSPAWSGELQASNDPQDESRLENLAQLASVAGEFMNDNADGTLADFLERVALVAEADELPDHEGGLVTLMTLHTAKGLEFDAVFLTGLEESVFPHARSLDDPVEVAGRTPTGVRRCHPRAQAAVHQPRGDAHAIRHPSSNPRAASWKSFPTP